MYLSSIGFQLPEEDKKQIVSIADSKRLSVSDFMRLLCLNAIRKSSTENYI